LFPLRDANKTLTTPHVNRMLILVNVAVSVVILLSNFGFIDSSFAGDIEERFSMTPYYIIRGEELYTLFTSVFLHDGLLHLFGNMLYLYIFGDNIEDVFGHVSYLVFYIFSGLAASFAYILSITNPNVYTTPVVGASGAIAGVLGAYLILYPKARILTLIIAGWPIIVPVPAIFFLGFWFLMQWLEASFGVVGNVAWWAHIGGFIAGLALALIFGLKRKRAQEARFRL